MAVWCGLGGRERRRKDWRRLEGGRVEETGKQRRGARDESESERWRLNGEGNAGSRVVVLEMRRQDLWAASRAHTQIEGNTHSVEGARPGRTREPVKGSRL